MTTVNGNSETEFGVRRCADPAGGGRFYCEIIAATPAGEWYRLLHAECDQDDDDPIRRPAIRRIEDVTLAYARHMWNKCRDHWSADERRGAGVQINLTSDRGRWGPADMYSLEECSRNMSCTPARQITVMDKESQSICTFCAVDASRILAANDRAFAIADGFPVSRGHTLIIPNRHIASLFEATREERDALFDLLAVARGHVLNNFRPDGFNIGINDGSAAGQTVRHLHIHLIPRYEGDQPDPRGGVRLIFPGKADYWSVHKD